MKNSNWYRVYAGKYVHSIGGRTDRFTVTKTGDNRWFLFETATGRTAVCKSLKEAKATAAQWMMEEHQKWQEQHDPLTNPTPTEPDPAPATGH